MNARIDIKTPAGKSLEGFPKEFKQTDTQIFLGSGCKFHMLDWNVDSMKNDVINLTLSPGDIITIEVL